MHVTKCHRVAVVKQIRPLRPARNKNHSPALDIYQQIPRGYRWYVLEAEQADLPAVTVLQSVTFGTFWLCLGMGIHSSVLLLVADQLAFVRAGVPLT